MGLFDLPSPKPTDEREQEIEMPKLRDYNALQSMFLSRLVRLLRQRRDYANILEKNDWRMTLLNKAIYSTFCDCLEIGVADEARKLFAQHK
ncbi:MAG: hypothetical protein M0Z94_06155 [Dehalococcoidales bacterium]|nr:hypothetical protein [Dehalococcoidales bacterium]